MTRETVCVDTPAASATSFMVTRFLESDKFKLAPVQIC